MEIEKVPKFRIKIEEVKTKKHMGFSVYTNKPIKLSEMKLLLTKRIKEL